MRPSGKTSGGGAKWFVSVAAELGLTTSGSRYVPHPGCTTSDKAWVYANRRGIGFYCNKCGATGFHFHAQRTMRELRELRRREDEAVAAGGDRTVTLPRDLTETLPEEAVVWLGRAGIPTHQALGLGFRWSDYLERVVMPVWNSRGDLVYYQARAVDGRTPKYINPRVDRGSVLYRPYCAERGYQMDAPLVANEDFLSAVRCSHDAQAVSILGTKLSERQELFLGRFPLVLLWLDGDRAGQRGRTKIRRALEWHTRVVVVETPNDPKCYPDHTIKEILHAAKQHGSGVFRPSLPDV